MAIGRKVSPKLGVQNYFSRYRTHCTTCPRGKVRLSSEIEGRVTGPASLIRAGLGVTWRTGDLPASAYFYPLKLKPKRLCVYAFRGEFPRSLTVASESFLFPSTSDRLVTTSHRFRYPEGLVKQLRIGELWDKVSGALRGTWLLGALRGSWHGPRAITVHSFSFGTSFLRRLGDTVWCRLQGE